VPCYLSYIAMVSAFMGWDLRNGLFRRFGGQGTCRTCTVWAPSRARHRSVRDQNWYEPPPEATPLTSQFSVFSIVLRPDHSLRISLHGFCASSGSFVYDFGALKLRLS
jgi:hypothetical protein